MCETKDIRVYFNKFTRWNKDKWTWMPYTYAHNCSLEEQSKWNEIYLRYRARRSENGTDKDLKIPDFYSVERDANQFGLCEVTFTDIFGLKWTGKKGCEEEVEAPDYEGHLYYFWQDRRDEEGWDVEDGICISQYDCDSNEPPKDVFRVFNVGYPRFRKEWIDIKNIEDLEYHYIVENHLFKDTYIEIYYNGLKEKDRIYDCHNYADFVKALKDFDKTELLEKLMKQMNKHFNELKNSEREDERAYWPVKTAEEYFAEDVK